MNDITVQDIVSAGQDQGMRISVEANPGFIGDKQVTVTYRDENCLKENIARTLVSALFDHGDKITIYGDVHFVTNKDNAKYLDAYVNFRVDVDSTVTREELEEENETGSDSTLNV